ncbi:MAG: FHA domain-containing protein [Planctomycetes bacterium]|nr:FHA domain-containing protein [Planctomycetota bacterium]
MESRGSGKRPVAGGAPPQGRRPPQGGRPPDSKRRGGASSRRQRQAPTEIISWLCCDPLPPIPLGPKPILTIGRSDQCDLVLPHKEVSRVHALIKVRIKAKMIVIEDEGSSNGTFVNGKRTPSTILKEGDVITLGPYEVMVRSRQDMHKREEKDDSTNSFELTSVARIIPSAAMTGLIQEVPMTEVLQGIEFNKKKGTLAVTSADRLTGVLVFVDGKPMYAGFGDLRDDEAVLAMIALKAGSFALTGDVEPGEKRMTSSMTGLLLEASRQIDEADFGSDEEEDVEQGFDALDALDPPSEPDEAASPEEEQPDEAASPEEEQPDEAASPEELAHAASTGEQTDVALPSISQADLDEADASANAESPPEEAAPVPGALEKQDTVGRLFDTLEEGG